MGQCYWEQSKFAFKSSRKQFFVLWLSCCKAHTHGRQSTSTMKHKIIIEDFLCIYYCKILYISDVLLIIFAIRLYFYIEQWKYFNLTKTSSAYGVLGEYCITNTLMMYMILAGWKTPNEYLINKINFLFFYQYSIVIKHKFIFCTII